MPRQGRIGIAGQLYHVIARGNERKLIFVKEEDCENFVLQVQSNLERIVNLG